MKRTFEFRIMKLNSYSQTHYSRYFFGQNAIWCNVGLVIDSDILSSRDQVFLTQTQHKSFMTLDLKKIIRSDSKHKNMFVITFKFIYYSRFATQERFMSSPSFSPVHTLSFVYSQLWACFTNRTQKSQMVDEIAFSF